MAVLLKGKYAKARWRGKRNSSRLTRRGEFMQLLSVTKIKFTELLLMALVSQISGMRFKG
jgi:hypothetical protein